MLVDMYVLNIKTKQVFQVKNLGYADYHRKTREALYLSSDHFLSYGTSWIKDLAWKHEIEMGEYQEVTYHAPTASWRCNGVCSENLLDIV